MDKTRIELECAIADCVLMSNGQSIGAVDIDTIDFIYPPANVIIGAARELPAIDLIIVRAWAKGRVSAAEISSVVGSVATAHNLSSYVRQLKRVVYDLKQAEIREGLSQKAKSPGDLIGIADELIKSENELSEKYLDDGDDGSMMQAAFEITERIEAGVDDKILKTNFPEVDDVTCGGLMGNEYYILAARPGIGKSAFALQLATDCDKKVVLFSLEMSKKQLAGRMLASTALKNTVKVMRSPSKLTSQEKNDFLAVSPTFYQAASRVLVFDKASQYMHDIARIAAKAVADGAELIIIDYLQLVKLRKGPIVREQYISEISGSLKALAKDLNVPVIVLSQLSRKNEEQNRAPVLSDLRESGSLEQDADVVWFLYPKDKDKDKSKSSDESNIISVWLLQCKNRHVGERARCMMFNKNHQRFYSLSAGGN